MNDEVIVIVDGYSSGKGYAPKFKQYGYESIHVQSMAKIDAAYNINFNADDYKDCLVYQGNIEQLLNKLAKYKIKFVIPASEPGVELADELSERLGVLTNGTKLSAARSDKFKMIEAVHQKGLATARYLIADHLDDILAWAEKLNQWPVVLKPLRSAGANLVIFCHNPKEITAAFCKIFSTPDFFGQANRQVLVQSCLIGVEHVLNCVSYGGKHYLSDMWSYKKRKVQGAGLIYDYAKLLPYEYPYRELLTNYVFQVLDALEIKYGASHSEVMLTKTGPILVETGARVMGAINPNLINQALERNQLDLTIQSYLNPEQFVAEISQPYQIKEHMLVKMLISSVTGAIKQIRHLEKIKALKSFVAMDLSVSVKGKIKKTIDLFTSPGTIILLHEDADVVMADYQTIAAIESEMFEIG